MALALKPKPSVRGRKSCPGLVVTGRGKSAIDDHLDRAFKLDATLR
jgi:hypothetical protein